MSHIYGDYEATLRALDVQSGNPRLAKLEEYGVDHATLMAELKILEKPVINRDELRHKSIEQIAIAEAMVDLVLCSYIFYFL